MDEVNNSYLKEDDEDEIQEKNLIESDDKDPILWKNHKLGIGTEMVGSQHLSILLEHLTADWDLTIPLLSVMSGMLASPSCLKKGLTDSIMMDTFFTAGKRGMI